MTLRLNKDIGFGAFSSGGGAASILNTTNAFQEGVVAASHTYSGLNLGADDGTGRVIVACGVIGNAGLVSISLVTVAGTTAAEVVTGANAFERVGINAASGVSGTSGDVVITGSANLYATFVSVYRLTGGSIIATTSGTDTDSNPATWDLDVVAGGVAVGVVTHRSDATTETFSWANLTETYDVEYQADDQYGGTAAAAFATAQTDLAISVTASTAGTRSQVMAVASFPPA
jgi:hypothetical protein